MRNFKLSPSFMAEYQHREPKWGYGELSKFTYQRTYSRVIYDEDEQVTRTEEWWETVKRVVEGNFSYQKQHCKTLGLMWDNAKAQHSAQVMYDKIFNFKFLPPGRGLWISGTDYVDQHGSMALNNCGFVSTEAIDLKPTTPFEWAMNALMMGVGVGFDTLGANKIVIQQPAKLNPWTQKVPTFAIPDSREGWVEALRWKLKAYFSGKPMPDFDYNQIRPAGEPIRGFGGTSAGFKPLKELLDKLDDIYQPLIGNPITVTAIVDTFNLIARCVVSGNVRRCLPEYYEIRTESGWKSIADVIVGDNVIVDDKIHRVTNKFDSGELEKYIIYTKDRYHESSADHRWKVYNVNTREYQWIQVDQLIPKTHCFVDDNDQKFEITHVRPTGKFVQMYDIGVETVHCFNARHPISKLESISHNSAEIALGDIDSDEFINLKNWEKNPERLAPKTGWGWTSNNTVYATVGKTDYQKIVDNIVFNGEPGVFWVENARAFGRMQDDPTWSDRKVAGLNPCVVGETIVITDKGEIRTDELVEQLQQGKSFKAKSMNVETGEVSYQQITNGVLTKHNAETMTLTFEENGKQYSIECTPEHEIYTRNRGYVEAQNITEEDDVVIDQQELE